MAQNRWTAGQTMDKMEMATDGAGRTEKQPLDRGGQRMHRKTKRMRRRRNRKMVIVGSRCRG